jgi:hypothetical protein
VSKSICNRCSEPLVKPAEWCGWCREELKRRAVKALAGSKSDRAHAIWFLHERMGYSKAAVAHALADAGRGYSVDQILKGLAGVEQVGAVAA